MALETVDIESIRESIGKKLGVSGWLAIDQDRITEFGRVTDDMDPMHVDVDWSGQKSPYRKTVAFGFLTLSLITRLYRDVSASMINRTTGRKIFGLNYGFDHVRLTAPIPVNSRIRGHFSVIAVTDRSPHEFVVKLGVEIEVEGADRVALVAEWLILLIDEEAARQIADRQ
jgi:acyl dehydratase